MASALDLLRDAKRNLIRAIEEIEEDKYWLLPKESLPGSIIFLASQKGHMVDGLTPNRAVENRVLEVLPDIEKLTRELERIDKGNWRPLEYRREKKGDKP